LLADQGFKVDSFFVSMVQFRKNDFARSPSARAIYFNHGQLLQVGDSFKQPALAQTLRRIAKDGESYFYRGDWAKAAVKAVRQKNGRLSLKDLADYRALWLKPLSIDYGNATIYAPAPPSFGGAKSLLTLQIMKHFIQNQPPHWASNDNSLVSMVRIAFLAQQEPWLTDQRFMGQRSGVEEMLTGKRAAELWEQLTASPEISVPSGTPTLSHSHCIAIVDRDGNAITGTNTVESYPFGKLAVFVGGIPLNSAGVLGEVMGISLAPGSFVPEPFSNHIVLKDQHLELLTGAIASSIFPADVQILSNALDYGMRSHEALQTPRFGNWYIDGSQWPPSIDKQSVVLDPRFGAVSVRRLEALGLKVHNTAGATDTGALVMIENRADGLNGSVYPFVDGAIDGD
jgi:gamma-glutamyltranspeptidase / glutathione hydrolase